MTTWQAWTETTLPWSWRRSATLAAAMNRHPRRSCWTSATPNGSPPAPERAADAGERMNRADRMKRDITDALSAVVRRGAHNRQGLNDANVHCRKKRPAESMDPAVQ